MTQNVFLWNSMTHNVISQEMVTHNFSRSPSSKGGFEIPKLPEKVVQLKDGDSLKISDEGSFIVKN